MAYGNFILNTVLARPEVNNSPIGGRLLFALVLASHLSYFMETFFFSTLAVTLAEIGDKTQLLSLFLAAKFKNKWSIVAGLLVATVLNHAASAYLGQWASQYVQSGTGQIILSSSFILLGLWLFIPDKDEQQSSKLDKYGAFVVTLILFFIAELGDKTQVATVLLAVEYQNVLLVTLGTTLGMLLANVPVIWFGSYIMERLPLNVTRFVAGGLFILFGVLQLVI